MPGKKENRLFAASKIDGLLAGQPERVDLLAKRADILGGLHSVVKIVAGFGIILQHVSNSAQIEERVADLYRVGQVLRNGKTILIQLSCFLIVPQLFHNLTKLDKGVCQPCPFSRISVKCNTLLS